MDLLWPTFLYLQRKSQSLYGCSVLNDRRCGMVEVDMTGNAISDGFDKSYR